MSHSNYQLACAMADDLKGRSWRLRALEMTDGKLFEYCRLWVEEFLDTKDYLLTSSDVEVLPGIEENGGIDPIAWTSRIIADRKLVEVMPLWLWLMLGQLLLKLIWEWWQNRENINSEKYREGIH